jgi:flagellar motor switch protein FliM
MDVLSQDEIDALLNALSTGEVDIEEMKEPTTAIDYKYYDFRRPNKLSKEHLRTIQVLHNTLARYVSNYLTGFLRNNIQIEVVSVDQLIYEDFIRSIPSPTVITVFKVNPYDENALIQFDPQFLFPMVEMFFGGSGEAPGEVRELTDIELSVTRTLSRILLDNFEMTLKEVTEISTEVVAAETNPNLHQIFPFNEIIALVTMTTKVGDAQKGFMSLCLPFPLMDHLVVKPSQQRRFGSLISADAKESKKIQHWLGMPKVEVTVVTGRTDITVRDFVHLQVGDVLVVDRKIDQDMDVYVDDNLKFKAQAGSIGSQFAVKITALAREEVQSAG